MCEFQEITAEHKGVAPNYYQPQVTTGSRDQNVKAAIYSILLGDVPRCVEGNCQSHTNIIKLRKIIERISSRVRNEKEVYSDLKTSVKQNKSSKKTELSRRILGVTKEENQLSENTEETMVLHKSTQRSMKRNLRGRWLGLRSSNTHSDNVYSGTTQMTRANQAIPRSAGDYFLKKPIKESTSAKSDDLQIHSEPLDIMSESEISKQISANQSHVRSTGDNVCREPKKKRTTSAKSDGSQKHFDTSDVITEAETSRKMSKANQSTARSSGDNIYKMRIKESMTSLKSDDSQINFDKFDGMSEAEIIRQMSKANQSTALATGKIFLKKPKKKGLTSAKSDGSQIHFNTFDDMSEPKITIQMSKADQSTALSTGENFLKKPRKKRTTAKSDGSQIHFNTFDDMNEPKISRQMSKANQSTALSTGDNFYKNPKKKRRTSAEFDGSQIHFDTFDNTNEPEICRQMSRANRSTARSTAGNFFKGPMKECKISAKSDGDGSQIYFNTIDDMNEPETSSQMSRINQPITRSTSENFFKDRMKESATSAKIEGSEIYIDDLNESSCRRSTREKRQPSRSLLHEGIVQLFNKNEYKAFEKLQNLDTSLLNSNSPLPTQSNKTRRSNECRTNEGKVSMKSKISGGKRRGKVSKNSLSPLDKNVVTQMKKEIHSVLRNSHDQKMKSDDKQLRVVMSPLDHQENNGTQKSILERNLDMKLLQAPSTSQTDGQDSSYMIDDVYVKIIKQPGKVMERDSNKIYLVINSGQNLIQLSYPNPIEDSAIPDNFLE